MYMKIAKRAIAEVSTRRGVSETVVIEEIQYNIDEAMRSADPLVQVQWRRMFGADKKPTAVEFLAYLVQHQLSGGGVQI